MKWQDVVFSAGSLVFLVSLVPTLIGTKQPSLWTSIPTALVLWVFGVTYSTLQFHFSAIVTFASASLWVGIATRTIIESAKVRRTTTKEL